MSDLSPPDSWIEREQQSDPDYWDYPECPKCHKAMNPEEMGSDKLCVNCTADNKISPWTLMPEQYGINQGVPA